jgi:hypothetical protein
MRAGDATGTWIGFAAPRSHGYPPTQSAETRSVATGLELVSGSQGTERGQSHRPQPMLAATASRPVTHFESALRGDSTARGHAHSLKMLLSHGCGARHKLRCWPTYFIIKALYNGLLVVEFLHDRDLTSYVGVHKNSDSLRVQSRL